MRLNHEWFVGAFGLLLLVAGERAACSAEPARERSGELLVNGGFEGAGGRIAPAWAENTWAAKGADQRQHVSWALDARVAHGGTTAQRLAVAQFVPGGGTILFQNIDFQPGHVYEGRIWLRAERPTKVKFYFRKRSFPYNTGAAAVVTAGPEWQPVVIRGGYQTAMPSQFLVQPLEPGTLWLDDASLRDVTDEVVREPLATADPIPREFFGMHINKLGSHNTWPPVTFGTLRLWDTGTTWAALEPQRGTLEQEDNWKPGAAGQRLVYYLRHRDRHDPTCQVIYTLGVTPRWAAAPGGPKFYSGTANPPQDLEDWRRYVRAVGQRFGGQIRFWEIWNEADQGHQYHGDVKTLCEMTRIAREELKALSPAHQILSPNITIQGVALLDEFLGAGGGRYVDIISWHDYPTLRPEENLPAIAAVRDVMKRHAVRDKPLWNTEGKPGGVQGEADLEAVAGDAAARAAIARTHLIQWAYGVRLFCWYFWDTAASETSIKLSRSSQPSGRSDFAELTPAGKAYDEVAKWLIGARMVGKSVEPIASGGARWTLELARDGGYRGWIVWNTQGASNLAVPAPWGARHVRRLTGSRQAFEQPTLSIGPEPILLENRPVP